MSTVLRIERLGAQGDGIARTPEGPVYVPFSLPGEAVEVTLEKNRGSLVSLRQVSPQRIAPACRHFGACGGCAVQHLDPAAYRDWKRGLVVQALQGRGLDAEVEPLVPCAAAARRRVTFAVRRTAGGILLGFNRALSHHIVPIEECPVAVPAIGAALGGLRALAGYIAMTGKPFRLGVTATASGLDIAAEGGGRLTEQARLAAGELAIAKGFARLSVDGETVIEARPPLVSFGGVPVAVPSGGFLQAVAGAEEAMATLVCTHLAGAKRLADLFAGSGAFALRLARQGDVHAVEGDSAALRALDAAARSASGLMPVSVERRDLFRRPLLAQELTLFDGLVLDPPRAGAEAQARQIARSLVPRVAAVSCNPATLARDLAILVEGGYEIRRIVPLDQFLWSPHVEVVALLEKRKRQH